jgi:hypothetical protein
VTSNTSVGASHIEVVSFQVVRRCFGRRDVDAKEHSSFVPLQEIGDLGGITFRDRRASADREQFEIAIVLETDDGIGKASRKVATR